MDRGRSLLLAGALLVLAAPALAQQPTQQQIDAIRSACRWDFMSNCSGVPRGGREAVLCLKEHLAKLSAACQTAVTAIIPKAPAAVPAAAPAQAPAPAAPAPAAAAAPPPPPAPAAPAPAAAPAPTASVAAPPPPPPKKRVAAPPPKPARNATPVHAVTAAPPPAPPAAAPAAPPADLGPIPPLRPLVRLQILRACRAEHDAYCGQVLPGQGRIVACLAAHGTELSPGCRDAIVSAKP